MKLERIGFYTLSDWRAQHSSINSALWRCELILTDACNFNCKYCRSLKPENKGTMPFEDAKHVIDLWADGHVRNIRLSGGEPTCVPYLLDLVKYTRTKRSIRHIALSTNGSASTLDYLLLNAAGVNDFSISLDSCCAATADKIADKKIDLDIISKNIKTLSSITHVTVGIVCTEDNVSELNKTIEYAHNLGVSDIRIIPSAQWNNRLRPTIDKRIIKAHPILKYRMNNIKRNIPFRGIDSLDCHRCPLVLDDIAVVGADHYPCIIYLREHGMPMGIITGKTIEEIRHERLIWYETHNSFLDPICKKNCLDVCKMYNLMASRRYPHEK